MELQALVLIPNIASLGQKGMEFGCTSAKSKPTQVNDNWYFPAIPTWKDQFGAPNILLGVILFHEEKSRA